ncbi:hypothetical protein MZK49_00725 [Ensifer sesbaniae]|uniref:hypothetical protein n=1 Tax=Ensifer sesbaniae TaxID=1214071 RepID=UPI00200068BE|nr:hypothetical protein [Ensifer sesbaniae]
MSAAHRQIEIDEQAEVIDEVAAAVAWHDGALVEATMSVGFARGWRPSADRTEDTQ